jgi:hypothetical protein
MHSQALAMDWIFQPVRWAAEWLRYRASRRLERRQAPRRMIPRLVANYCEGTAAASHIVRDISTKGAFIFADFKWQPGTTVTLTLQLEEPFRGRRPPAPVLIRTKVVRCTRTGLGVQFLLLSKTERQSVANFLKGIAESRPR